MLCTPIVPNGFADHYPVSKNGYFIGKINPTFSDKAISLSGSGLLFTMAMLVLKHHLVNVWVTYQGNGVYRSTYNWGDL